VTTWSYYAWLEYVPLSLQTLPNLPVSPGDHITAEVYNGDQQGNADVDGSYVWFYIYDWQTANYILTSIQSSVAGASFQGNTAEFIMERPTTISGLPRLADYGTATMWNPWVMDMTSQWYRYSDLSHGVVTMKNASNYTLADASDDSSYIYFNWYQFQ
jgi:hypothetical protein